jgi:hypothetical protein
MDTHEMLVRSRAQAATVALNYVERYRFVWLKPDQMPVYNVTFEPGREKTKNKKENGMRMIMAAVLAMTASASVAMADEIEDAHRQAISSRDSYWNCLAQQYSQGNKSMSDQDFTLHIASVCPSERQSFRASLVDYLSMQFPSVDADAHMTTANKAIALAQKDIVTAFVRHKAAAK